MTICPLFMGNYSIHKAHKTRSIPVVEYLEQKDSFTGDQSEKGSPGSLPEIYLIKCENG